jgi:predicted glutamine amidotransferase
MCRLFGLLTTRDDAAEPWLLRTDRSLLAQSHASEESAQRDGWGIAWFAPGGRAHIERGVRGAFEPGERESFVAAAKASAPPLVVGHLRRASNPLGLPPEQLLGPLNSQPFGTHTALFAHNGAIPFPRETRPYLGVHEREVRGVNDSEVLFRLLLRHAEELGDPLRAYSRAVDDLIRVWQEVGRPNVRPFSGLNVLFSPGPRELWAFCLWTGEHGTGLLDRTRPYYEMTYQSAPHRLVVGSEPFDEEKGVWTSLRRGRFLHAVSDGQRLALREGPIPLPSSLELTAPPAQ